LNDFRDASFIQFYSFCSWITLDFFGCLLKGAQVPLLEYDHLNTFPGGSVCCTPRSWVLKISRLCSISGTLVWFGPSKVLLRIVEGFLLIDHDAKTKSKIQSVHHSFLSGKVLVHHVLSKHGRDCQNGN
jgi:hypothetical protein